MNLIKEDIDTETRFNSAADSFPQADSIAQIVRAYMGQFMKQKFQMLDFDAYPALFSRFFALSIKDKDLHNNIDFFVSDADADLIAEIQDKHILDSLDLNLEYLQASYKDLVNNKSAEFDIVHCSSVMHQYDESEHLDLVNALLSLLNEDGILILNQKAKDEIFDLEALNHEYLYCQDLYLHRLIVFKNPKIKTVIEPIFNSLYIENNNIELFADLMRSLNKVCCPQALKVHQFMIEQLLKIDGYSSTLYFFLSQLYKLGGQKDKAIEQLKKAEYLDFYKQIDTATALNKIEKLFEEN